MCVCVCGSGLDEGPSFCAQTAVCQHFFQGFPALVPQTRYRKCTLAARVLLKGSFRPLQMCLTCCLRVVTSELLQDKTNLPHNKTKHLIPLQRTLCAVSGILPSAGQAAPQSLTPSHVQPVAAPAQPPVSQAQKSALDDLDKLGQSLLQQSLPLEQASQAR